MSNRDFYESTTSPVKNNDRYRRASSLRGALICAVIFLAVILVSVFVISSNRERPAEDTGAITLDPTATYPYDTIPAETSPETVVTETTDLSFIGPPPALTEPDSASITVDNTQITRGDLILINGQHPYSFDIPEKQTVFYGNKSPCYKLSLASISIDSDLFPLFDQMMIDFSTATGCKDLLITSGYRTYEDQEEIMASRVASMGAEKAALYVANPGHSAHHSGLALDLGLFIGGRQYYFPEHEMGAWIIENAPKYGFILRYTEEMSALTGCAAEPWHYRYIGTPHAQLVTDLGLCYEQYVEYLYSFTWEEDRLFIAPDGTTTTGDGFHLPAEGHMVYYVPANMEADSTEILLPLGYDVYSVSGDNVGGFFVTVDLTSYAEPTVDAPVID